MHLHLVGRFLIRLALMQAATARRSLASVVVLVAGMRAVAPASPLEDPTLGSAVFTGPAHPHASSIYLSPAALALADRGQHFYVGTSIRLSSLRIQRRNIDPTTGDLSEGATAKTTTASPRGLLGFYTSLQDRYHLGVALHTPVWERFASKQEPLRYHVLGGQTRQVLGSLGAGIVVTSRIVVGVGLSLGYSKFRLGFARDTALDAGSGAQRGIASDCGGTPCGLENDLATQRYTVDVDTGGFGGLFTKANLGFSGGLAVQLARDWWLAASWLSPPGAISGDLELVGTADVSLAPRDGGGELSTLAEITYRMPWSLLLGLRGPLFPGYEIVGGARWQAFSRQDKLDIRLFGRDLSDAEIPEWYPRYRGLKDVWRVEVGLEAQQDRPLRLGARFRLESGAVDSANVSPLQVDGFNIAAGAGANVRISEVLVLSAGVDLTYHRTLDSTESDFDPRDRLACVDSGFEFSTCEAAREGRAVPTAAGRYRRLQGSLLLSLRYDYL